MGVIAKYKFNNTLADLLPEFNSEFTSDLYTVTDEVNGEVTTRTIESDNLPTLMRFGAVESSAATERSKSLLEIISLDISNCKNLYHYFRYCINLTTVNGLIVHSGITNLDNMFGNCNSLEFVDTSNWNTSNVTIMSFMFYYCTNLTTLDVSSWNTSKVTSMYCMFYNCNNLTSLDVSNWDTSNVTDMSHMFYNCNNLTSLDVSNFNTSNVADTTNMLTNTNNLKYLKCNNVATLNKLNTYLPTKSSTSQGTIICKSDITNLDTTTLQSKYWNILDEPTLIAKYVFDKSIHNNYIPEFNAEFEGYFIEDEVEEGNNEVTRTIESCGMLPTLMRFGNIISSSSLLEILDIDTSALTSMWSMFLNCSNLTSVSCNWNTTSVTDMWAVFSSCSNLTSLDVSNWDTSKVNNMNYLFSGCNKLTTLDVSNWDTSKVNNMYYMFYNCNKLTTLDVSNWDISNVTNMDYMFGYCYNLTTLDVSNWDISNVSGMNDMFDGTPLLTDISVLYMDKSSLQKLVDAMPTDSNKTLWYKDVNIDGITHGNNITLKKYMEENVEIVLNSPLLEGDTIEVKDGKLCHYHKMGMIVLDGSEDWTTWINSSNSDGFSSYYIYYDNTTLSVQYTLNVPSGNNKPPLCDKLIGDKMSGYRSSYVGINSLNGYLTITLPHIELGIDNNTTIDDRLSSFKQWLSKNPTTVVYELETPYYENITNLQSAPTLKTYLECSMEIDTDLPIDTNVTYRTNLSSVYVMERELDELDNGTDLGDILEGEVNE